MLLSQPKSAIGSCFVEFATDDEQKKAVDAKEKVAVGGVDCEVTPILEWLASNSKGGKRNNNNNNNNGRPTKKDDSKKGDAPAAASNDPVKIEPLEHNSSCVIVFTGMPEGSDREAIRAAFEGVEGVKVEDIYVDYSRGEKDGSVRFKETFSTIKDVAAKFAAGEMTIAEAKVDGAKVLEGEEEDKYWTEAARMAAERKRKFNDRGNNRGGRGGGHKKQRRR